MMKAILFIICVTLSVRLAFAQVEISIAFDFLPADKNKLDLFYSYGNEYILNQTSIADEETFRFTLNEPVRPGQYRLAFGKDGAGTEILVSGTEHLIQIQTEYFRFGSAPPKFESRENEAYALLVEATKRNRQKLDEIDFKAGDVSKLDSFYYTKKATFRLEQANEMELYNDVLREISKKYEGTLTATVYCPLFMHPGRTKDKAEYSHYDNDRAYNRDHFFDYTDFEDPRILTHSIFKYFLVEYLKSFGGRNIQDMEQTIDFLFNNYKFHPEVKQSVISACLDYFISQGLHELIDYVLVEYLDGCTSDLGGNTKDRMELYAETQPGKMVSNFQMTTPEGTVLNLESVIGKKKVTLIVFWASWCDHCMSELPILSSIYAQHEKELSVFAFSLDTEKSDWENAIRELKLNWLNGCDFKKWQSPIAKQYSVLSTPYILVVDDSGLIIEKLNSLRGIRESLAKYISF